MNPFPSWLSPKPVEPPQGRVVLKANMAAPVVDADTVEKRARAARAKWEKYYAKAPA